MVLPWRLLQRGFLHLGRMELVLFLRKDLRQPLRKVKQPADLTITIATKSDIEPLLKLTRERFRTQPISEFKEYEELIRYRFKKGSLCFIAKDGQEVVHSNWISFRPDYCIGGHYLHLKKDEAHCLDGFTQEKWRGKGAHPAVHNLMLNYLQEHGYLKAYTLADWDNKPPQKGLQVHGWSNLGLVFCFTRRGASKGWFVPFNRNLAKFLKARLLDYE